MAAILLAKARPGCFFNIAGPKRRIPGRRYYVIPKAAINMQVKQMPLRLKPTILAVARSSMIRLLFK
jgi:hypothetical protein